MSVSVLVCGLHVGALHEQQPWRDSSHLIVLCVCSSIII